MKMNVVDFQSPPARLLVRRLDPVPEAALRHVAASGQPATLKRVCVCVCASTLLAAECEGPV